MKTILITGGRGFVGRNLCAHLERLEDVTLIAYDLGDPESRLEQGVAQADVIFHLAGVNRPPSEEEFRTGNTGFTEELCDRLTTMGRTPHIVFSSTIQATLDNPYGASKRAAEETLRLWAEKTGGRVTVFRFTNLFGKWCRPNYNSVVATFCHNIA
ncbi:MAG: NAD-dependent epimerase/dehydratase family protein, partial [Planctomycetia bacterium]|nr:NAD-dependent epimerase/dehydratase family protein [Planctomycetia bacterium]